MHACAVAASSRALSFQISFVSRLYGLQSNILRQGWAHWRTAPLLTELSVSATQAIEEQASALEQLQLAGAAEPTTAPAASVSRYSYLAQLVPALLRRSATKFGEAVAQSREMLSRHRRERERLCEALQLVQHEHFRADLDDAQADLNDGGRDGTFENPAKIRRGNAFGAALRGVKTRLSKRIGMSPAKGRTPRAGAGDVTPVRGAPSRLDWGNQRV